MPTFSSFRRSAAACLLVAIGACSEPAPSPDAPPAPAPATSSAWRDAATFTVCLQPLGDHDATLLTPVARGITQAYGFSVRVVAEQPLPQAAWYPPRQRWRAENILYHLFNDVLPTAAGCDAMVGFTAADVSVTMGEHPDWGVLGLGYLDNNVAVVSSFRLRRGVDRRRVVERAVKVVIHELGHVVGLPHGNDGAECVMNDARGSVRTIDRSRGTLCAAERTRVEARLRIDLPERAELDWDAILAGAVVGAPSGAMPSLGKLRA
jgi:archaemetzincin